MTKGEQTTGYQGYGEAYGFFNSRATLEQLKEDMPLIRKGIDVKYGIPDEVELELREVKDLASDRNTPSDLIECINEGNFTPIRTEKNRKAGITPEKMYVKDLKYVIKATYASRTNKDAAEQLGNALNAVYQRYDKGDNFAAVIIGRDPNGKYNGRYSFWEEEMRKAA